MITKLLITSIAIITTVNGFTETNCRSASINLNNRKILFGHDCFLSNIKATPILYAVKDQKEDQFTIETKELLDVMKSKMLNGVPHLIVAQVAPSVRVSISEEFDKEPGTLPTGNLVAALKAIGFDLVLDTNTGADFTICEEGTELLERIKTKIRKSKKEEKGISSNKPVLPLFTSCCPGWLALVQNSYPELIPFISTCKSPHMMYGALIKEFSVELFNEQPDKVYFCSVMPCVRKRGESDHAAFSHNGIRDIDNVITTKDLGMILRSKNINPFDLQPELFDSPFQTDGIGTGAGQLFGATGGVMEAAVRTVYEIVTGEEMPNIELDVVRGLEGVKEAVIPLTKSTTTNKNENNEGNEEPQEIVSINVAVVSGLGNAKKLIKKIANGEVEYDFIEVMACPGGCIGGGGQPAKGDLGKRMEYIYSLDRSLPRRKSHDNPVVQRMYAEFLDEEFGSEKAHELLHVEPIYGEETDTRDSND